MSVLAVNGPLRSRLRRLPHGAIRKGLPPRTLGYRWVERRAVRDAADAYEMVEPPRRESYPLPAGWSDRDALPDDAGWWGYSMRDVPERLSTETGLATLKDGRLAFARDRRGQFSVGLLTREGVAADTREIVFRPEHAASARGRPRTLDRAVWVTERVYGNYSHWLAAHLPKLLMLRREGRLDGLILPKRLSAVAEETLRRLGIPPDDTPRFDEERPLVVGELTVPVTDRFRPSLLRPLRAALAGENARGRRRLYVSRAKARGRKLANEDEIWPMLEARGFERVFLEEHGFAGQLDMMSDAQVIAAPHGAGLTNMILAPEGTAVIEIADLAFPNPNFYALACAMGHAYDLVPAQPAGGGELLLRDMAVDPQALMAAVDRAIG
ncbi:glycosyltransferase family 61 protein [Parvularcula oceani]|uniref:glycosyltransferase family 61 protein n=1 Tax=Parvularcula oceani TaxID=1247963 RepID=UPI0004E1FE02|nr:glycosyltransferase family 61 protein [Parvularcula oceani]